MAKTRPLVLAIVACFCATAVPAQDAAGSESDQEVQEESTGANETESEGKISEEIIVTAQKREQSAQDIGISIVALGSDELESLGVSEARELTEFVPNMELSVSGDSDIPVFVIRGVGLQDYNANNTPTTAMVVDDVYQPYGVYGAFSLFDTERVEILRGPQGGLYGRNSTGGAINLVSRRPVLDGFNANVAADVGNYGTLNLRGGVGFQTSDKTAARLAIDRVSSDGYFRNTFLNRDQGGKDKNQARLSFLFAPAESFTADLRFTYGTDNSEVGIPELEGYLDPNTRWEGPLVPFGSPPMNVPFNPDGTPAYCDAVLTTGIPDENCITANGLTPDGRYRGGESQVRKNDDEFSAASLNLSWQLDGFSLVSISSVASMDFFHTNGSGAAGIADFQNPAEWETFGRAVGRQHGGAVDPNYITEYDSDISSWSQEFRLLSTSGRKFDWMVGAVYAEDELAEDRYCEFPSNLYFDYAVFPGCGTMIYDQDTTAWSVYGQVSIPLSDNLKLTADARYTAEEKDYLGGVWINDGAWTCTLLGFDLESCAAVLGYDPVTNLFPLAVGAQAEYAEDEPSFKVNLDYARSADLLLYASVGRTFKSGGFFGGFFFSPDAIVAYAPETNVAVEAGFKSTLAGGSVRLNGSIFRYDYEDFQGNLNAQSATAGGGAVFSGLTNLGDAESFGAELDLSWFARNGFNLGVGLGFLDTEITGVADSGFTDPDVIVGVTNILAEVVDIVGNELNDAPQLSTNLFARHSFSLSEMWGGSVALNASWTDDYYLSVSNEPYAREDGVALLNVLAEVYRGTDGYWSLALWGRNLTDESYRTSTNDDGIFSNYSNWSEPRTFGATITYRY